MAVKLMLVLIIISSSAWAQMNCEKYSTEYVPVDLYDALNYLDCTWSKSDKDRFKNKSEYNAVSEINSGSETDIKENWDLWGCNTGISKYFRNLGIQHPDDMYRIIMTSFHRHLNQTDIELDEQIEYYLDN